MVEDRKLAAKEELKWRAEFETLAADIDSTPRSIGRSWLFSSLDRSSGELVTAEPRSLIERDSGGLQWATRRCLNLRVYIPFEHFFAVTAHGC